MGIPQWIYVILAMLSFGEALSRHGEVKKESRHNVYVIGLALAIQSAILCWGGFFG